MSTHQRPLCAALALASLAFAAAPALAQVTSSNRDVLTPNTGLWSGGGVTIGGTRFVNLGLQGVGRVAASAIDTATGESLGSVSSMQVTNFVNNGNGSWSGVFNFLPDRGYNITGTSDFRARLYRISIVFKPTENPAALPADVRQNTVGLPGDATATLREGQKGSSLPVVSTASQSLFSI